MIPQRGLSGSVFARASEPRQLRPAESRTRRWGRLLAFRQVYIGVRGRPAEIRLESLVIGGIILGFGILLVSTNGVIAGVNLPGLIGYPSCTGGSTANGTSPQCYGFAGFGVGTVVCIFGLGIIGNGLRSSATPKGFGRGASSMPPEVEASLAQARQSLAAMAATAGPPGSRYCPECGKPNAADAKFCQGCGRTMPPPQPVPASSASTPASASKP
jgi:zinc-ribbon domain